MTAQHGLKNAQSKNLGGQFGSNAVRVVPTAKTNVFDLGDGFMAQFKKADSHGNKAGQGVWRVSLSMTKNGEMKETPLQDEETLQRRISGIMDKRPDVAEKYKVALGMLKSKNSAPNRKVASSFN